MNSDDELQATLVAMPKPAVQDVVTGIGTQAKWILLVTAILLALAVAFYGLWTSTGDTFWQGCMIAMLIVSPNVGIIGGAFALWARVQNRKLRQMASGEYFVHWRIGDERWEQECERNQKRSRWLIPLISGGFAFVALVFAALVFWDAGDVFFGSPLLHFIGVGGLGAATGFVIGLFCRAMTRITERLMRTRTPQVIIGPAGVYVTGQFWPRSTFNQRLESVELASDARETLVFQFVVGSQHGDQNMFVRVPFPADQVAAAAIIPSLMMDARTAVTYGPR